MGFQWLSRLDCAPLHRRALIKRMAFIAQNFDSLYAGSGMDRPAMDKPSLLIVLDPDLSALAKQLADAEAEFARMKKLYAHGDPMLDMALWRLEGCQGSFDTRLLEVEADHELNELADDILLGRKPLEEMVQNPIIRQRMKKKEISTGLLVFVILMMLFQKAPFIGQPRPNRFASLTMMA